MGGVTFWDRVLSVTQTGLRLVAILLLPAPALKVLGVIGMCHHARHVVQTS